MKDRILCHQSSNIEANVLLPLTSPDLSWKRNFWELFTKDSQCVLYKSFSIKYNFRGIRANPAIFHYWKGDHIYFCKNIGCAALSMFSGWWVICCEIVNKPPTLKLRDFTHSFLPWVLPEAENLQCDIGLKYCLSYMKRIFNLVYVRYLASMCAIYFPFRSQSIPFHNPSIILQNLHLYNSDHSILCFS